MPETIRSSSATHRRPFADRLIERLRQLRHPLCVGLDPHLERIPPLFCRGSMRPGDPYTAEAIEAFLRAVLDRLTGRVAVVKPQIAFFEQLGWRGLRLLAAVVGQARRQGFEVLLDAKRGDVGATATAYAAAYCGPLATLPVDAITVQPYLGGDSLEPFFAHATEGCGVFVLVKTSNPGAADFQDRRLDSGDPLYLAVAERLAAAAEELRAPATGWSSLGVVVGATYPEASERVRTILPHALFLVPGYGAQGGTAADAVRGFLPGPGGRLEGGLVSSSRGVLFPEAGHTDDAARWEAAIDDALARAIDELGEAIAR